MAKKKQDSVNPEKEKRTLELTKRFQEELDKKECRYMSDFLNKWNKSNKEKIQDMVKIKNQLIIHLAQYTISIQNDYMRL